MKTCSNCSSLCSETARFCEQCGHPFGDLVIVYAVKVEGSKFQLKGNHQKRMKQFLEYNDEVYETPGAIIIQCFEADLVLNKSFVPHHVWFPSSHGPVETKCLKMEFVK